jgi:hypothetical protein
MAVKEVLVLTVSVVVAVEQVLQTEIEVETEL